MTYYSALHYAAKAEAAATTATTLLPYLTDITTVATNIASVNTVATNISSITTAATNISSINTVATDISNVNDVAADLTNINAVAADLTNIDNASQYAAEAKQWAIGDPSEPVDGSAKYWAQQAAGQVIPSQTGHNGEFLTTDGTALSWDTVDALPSQVGQSGKYLTTDGTDASWATLSVNPDNKSITTNASDQLQTIGVINQNDITTALKVWSGDEADLPAIKDANTFYATEELGVSLLDTLYPVGSIYITTNAACPLSTLIAGSTWVLVGQDRVLQGAGTRGVVGTTLNESLPNIKGGFNGSYAGLGGVPNIKGGYGSFDDAGSIGTTITQNYANSNSATTDARDTNWIDFDASLSSSTYQDNAPVQPDAYLVNIFRRIS